MRSRTDPLAWAALLITCAAFVLRLYRLDWQPLWDDEPFSMFDSSGSLLAIPWQIHWNKVPLYFLLMHLWMGLAGYSEFALRFVSLFFGVALVPVGYLLGKKLNGPVVGLLVALLFAVVPPLVYQSQVARMYTLLPFLGAVQLFFLFKLLEAPEGKRYWVGYGLATAAAIYTQYFALLLLLLPQLLFLPLLWRRRLPWRPYLVAHLLVGLSYVPWLLRLYADRASILSGAVSGVPQRPMPLERLAQEFWLALTVQKEFGTDLQQSLEPTAILLVLAALGVGALMRRRQPLGLWLASALVVALAASYAVNLVLPRFVGRYLLFTAPLLYLLVAEGVAFLGTRLKILLAPALLLALFPFLAPLEEYLFAQVREELPALQRFLYAHAQAQDLVLLNSGYRDVSFSYYHDKVFRQRPDLGVHAFASEAPSPRAELEARVNALAQDRERVWVVFFGTEPYNHTYAIEDALSKSHARVLDDGYGTTRLWLYARPRGAVAFADGAPQRARFGEELELVETSVAVPPSLTPSGAIPVVTRWHSQEESPSSYRISLRLLDQGYIWLQRDEPLRAIPPAEGAGAWEHRSGLLVPLGTPPGEYALTLSVYQGQNAEPLAVRMPGSQLQERSLVLARVRIAPPQTPPSLLALPPLNVPGRALNGELELLGGQLDPQVRAGHSFTLSLYWRATDRPLEDYRLRLRLPAGSTDSWADGTFPLGPAAYLPRLWRPGEVMRGQYRLRLGPSTPPGTYPLELTLMAPQTSARQAQSPPHLLASLRVTARKHQFEAPPPAHPLRAELGPAIRFLGFDLGSPASAPGGVLALARPGRSLAVTLHWQAGADLPREGIDRDYTVFLQLLDGTGRLVAQRDSYPQDGAAPTTEWVPGEVIVDGHSLGLPASLPPGEYALIAGLYDASTRQRLRTPQGQDHVTLGRVRVESSLP